jgi:hypothetical protein
MTEPSDPLAGRSSGLALMCTLTARASAAIALVAWRIER